MLDCAEAADALAMTSTSVNNIFMKSSPPQSEGEGIGAPIRALIEARVSEYSLAKATIRDVPG